MGGSRKFCQRGPFFSHQRILQRAVGTYLEKQLDPRGPFASQGEGGGGGGGGGGRYQYF